jgi:HEAT repeat protein
VAYAQSHFSDGELETNIPRLLDDRYSPVRRAALNVAAERLGEPAHRWLMRSLGDRGSTVRQVARFHLERRGELADFASHYRSELAAASKPRSLAAAAAGLGDTGTRADVALLVPLLTHDNASVRRAVARALASLDLDGQASRLLSLLDDRSSSVAHVARDTLHRRTPALDAEAIRHLITHAAHAHGRLGGVAVAAMLAKWDSIPLLLEAAASTEEALRTDATQRIAVWLEQQNQSFASPSTAQVEAFRAALETCGSALAPRTRESLASVLEYWAAH